MKTVFGRAVPFVLCSACGAALAFVLYHLAGLGAFEMRLYDLRARIAPSRELPGSGRVVCGLIDDQSIRAVGPWPWPRKVHALFLDSLRRSRPAVVAYDLKFVSESPDDAVFASTAAYYDAMCFSYDFRLGDAPEGASALPVSDDMKARERVLEGFALPSVPPGAAGLGAYEAAVPVPGLAACGLGFANAPRDTDGVLRRLPLVIACGGRVYPSFALFCVCRSLGVAPDGVRVNEGRVELVKDGAVIRSIPVDGTGSMLVRFARPGREPFRQYLYIQLMKSGRAELEGGRGDIAMSELDGKILMLGHTATGSVGSLDVGATPVSGYMPYMFAHAQAAENIIAGDFLGFAGPWADAAFSAAGALCAAGGAFAFGPWAALACFGALLCALCGANVWLFDGGLVVNMLLPLACAAFAFMFSSGWRLFSESRDKRFLKKVFGHYVSGAVLDVLLKQPEKLRLGGEKRELTVLFADIKGFTSYCEARDPELVVSQLNEYFDRMTEIICANNGTLDKYIGDCIMAVFGAPSLQACPDHAFMAVKSALEMVAALEALQEEWRRAGRDVLDIGIGINTGQMLVGNMGSSRVWDYTVIGDEVNLGARLESLTRERGVRIIISESTFRKVEGRVTAQNLGPAKVKGKARETVVYSVSAIG